MRKIITTIGISGSGKSTRAKEIQNLFPVGKVIIFSRDKFREMLFGHTEASVNEYYQKDVLTKEQLVSQMLENAVHEVLKADDVTVILDQTTLTAKYTKAIEKTFNYVDVFEYHFMHVPVDVAIERDSKRDRSVTEKVIRRQHEQIAAMKAYMSENYETISYDIDNCEVFRLENFIQPIVKNPLFPPAVLFDIDGTLADHTGKRSPYDWSKVELDDVIGETALVLRAIIKRGVEIIFVSGRDEVCRKETIRWIEDSLGIDVTNKILCMRPKDNMDADWIIKEEIWRKISKEYNIKAIFDDRLQVIRRANALGLFVFNVNQKNIEF